MRSADDLYAEFTADTALYNPRYEDLEATQASDLLDAPYIWGARRIVPVLREIACETRTVSRRKLLWRCSVMAWECDEMPDDDREYCQVRTNVVAYATTGFTTTAIRRRCATIATPRIATARIV